MAVVAEMIGERLREVRRESGRSLGALAEAAGVGKGSISEIENGTRNPTIGTLYALAGALGVPLATLLAERVGTEVGAPGFSATLLDVHRVDAELVEVYRLAFEPGTRREAGPHYAGVCEHLLVTSGRLRVGPRGAPRELSTGESATWRADTPHDYVALGDACAEAVLVMRSPDRVESRAGGI